MYWEDGAEYSSLAHVAQSLHFNADLSRQRWAMLSAYFDDSGCYEGARRTHAVVVCGFVSTVDQWLRFDSDWRHVLAMPQFDLEHLHMKELRSGKGRFTKFQDNLELQKDLFTRLHRLLRVRALETFGGAVLLDDYDAVNQDYLVAEELGPPLVMAAQLAIVKVLMWCAEHRPNERVKIFMDQGIKHWGIIDDRMYEEYGSRLIPASVKETPPLQAADHVAWELHRALATVDENGILPSPLKLRGSMRQLLRRFNRSLEAEMKNWFLYEEAEMRRVLPLNGIPRRAK